jgi:ATP synthase I chain.
MHDGIEPLIVSDQDVMPPSHTRILVIMAVLGLLGGIAGTIFGTVGFGLGIVVGTALAFGNYYWLKASLKRVFAEAEEGEKPKISALRYLTRYLVLGIVIAVVFASNILPIVPVILGLAAFGFATVVEGFIRIFTGLTADPADK